MTVWIVNDAANETQFDELQGRHLVGHVFGLSLDEVELYAPDGYFRTFFLLWSYQPGHGFQSNGERIDVGTFERLWKERVDGIEDLDILFYRPAYSLILIK